MGSDTRRRSVSVAIQVGAAEACREVAPVFAANLRLLAGYARPWYRVVSISMLQGLCRLGL